MNWQVEKSWLESPPLELVQRIGLPSAPPQITPRPPTADAGVGFEVRETSVSGDYSAMLPRCNTTRHISSPCGAPAMNSVTDLMIPEPIVE